MVEVPSTEPFRKEVPRVEVDRDEEVRERVGQIREIVWAPEDRPAGVVMILDEMNRPETPRESKLNLFKQAFDLIHGYGGDQYNRVSAGELLLHVQSERDPLLRSRYASILSHDIQLQYAPRGEEISEERLAQFVKKREAFRLTADDPNESPRNRAWARYLLEPGEQLQVLNKLYDEDPVLNLPLPQEHLITDVSEESPSPEDEGGDPKFTGETRLLRALFLPSRRAMREFQEKLGRVLPVSLVAPGKDDKYIRADLPEDVIFELVANAEDFRLGAISRMEVFKEAKAKALASLPRMHPDDLAFWERQIRDDNWDVRYTTHVRRQEEEEKEDAGGEQISA